MGHKIMELLLIQSQEHDKLPLAELKAVIETENINTKINILCSGLVKLENITTESFNKDYQILTKRLGYTHEVNQIIKKTNLENLETEIKNINWDEYLKETFVVRIKKFQSKLDSVKIERDVGGYILKKTSNTKVKLKGADSLVRIISHNNDIYICIQKYYLNKKHFEEIKPHKRPFFHPGGMSPKLARCMVNLSRIKKDEILLDPFCGTGGILIEAGLVGAHVIGSDINWKMKNGSAINLEDAGIQNYETYKIDFHQLKLPKPAKAVVTDPPYGISTTTGGINSEEVIGDFLDSIQKSITNDALIVTASPHYVNINEIFKQKGFNLKEQYFIKMHRSLTRVISVIEKI